jgi:hypothetical protein
MLCNGPWMSSRFRNLVARIPVLSDTTASRDEYINCFAEDAIWECVYHKGEGPPGQHLSSKIVGRARILADRARIREKLIQGPETNSFHLNTNLIVSMSSCDTATAESYWIFLRCGNADDWKVSTAGYYYDILKRYADGWKLFHRRFSIGKPKGGRIVP